MKRSLALLLPLALVACQDASGPVTPSGSDAGTLLTLQTQATEDVVPGEVIVKLRNNAELPEIEKLYELKLQRKGYAERFAVMMTARGGEHSMANRLAADPRVEFAEPNYLRQPHGAGAVDPRLWAFYNPGGLTIKFQNDSQGRDGQTVTSLISVNDADQDSDYAGNTGFAAGGGAVTIGSIDTGVDMNHPELAGRMIAGKDWVDNDNDPTDPATAGHGTHTTGTMAGLNVGVAGAAGAASNVKVFVQRVCGTNGCPTTAIIDAIYAAANFNTTYPNEPQMVAMNLSLGGLFISQAEKDAISYAVNTKGVLVIASAGNDNWGRVSCPACDANAISVAATSWMDQRSYYSNWGSGLDITAPGGEMYSNTTEEAGILSAVPTNYTAGPTVGGPIAGAKYAYDQGTSMSAPQVTGVAAIVASKTGLRGSALRSRIEGTTDDLGTKGYDNTFGWGRVNAYRAVTQTTLNEGGSPPPPPAVPAAPSSLTATAASNSQINLAWTDNSSNEDGFKIERCTGSSCTNFTQIATVGANVKTYSSTGLAASTTYRFRVRAYNAGGDSGYSNNANATTSSCKGKKC
ncbi:MAG: S8 family peptidase [Longimicrobiaceae bacterium]